MTLKENIHAEQISAMKDKNKERTSTLRSIMASIKQVEVDTRTELEDSEIVNLLVKMVKQRKESISDFDKAGRTDLSDVEKAEIIIIEEFLPKPLSEQETVELVQKVIDEVKPESMKDMGKVMAKFNTPEYAGRIDKSKISTLVKEYLSK